MFRNIKDYKNLKDKTVFLRVDFNVPVNDGNILDSTRIRAAIPTIEYLVANGCKVVVASHFGSPSGNGFEKEFSMKMVADKLQEIIPVIEVVYCNDCIGDNAKNLIKDTKFGKVVVLENLRFYSGEEANDRDFAKDLANLADIYVNDAFSVCHRKHASMVSLPELMDSCAGISLQKELDNLDKFISNPEKPLMVIAGGSKVSTKLSLLNALACKADYMVIGGGMANTFLKAKGYNVGKSVVEDNLMDEALNVIKLANDRKCEIILPVDVVVKTRIDKRSIIEIKYIDYIDDNDVIFDIGQETIEIIKGKIDACKTVVWNGPVGMYEVEPFHKGTEALAKYIASNTLARNIISVAGGGDILAALNKINVVEDFTYVSTAGGAFLKWLENGTLPAIEKLK